MSEPEIIKRCLKKDKTAWNLFVDKYCRLVYWAIRRRLTINNLECNPADIDDIFQEVFLTVLKGDKLLQLKDPKFISGWLAMIASNKTISFMREQSSCQRVLASDTLILRDDSSSGWLLVQDTLLAVKNILNTFSNKEKIIISLNLLEEKTHKEISQMLKIPLNTVSTIIARAKQKLKRKLQNRGIGENF